MGLVRYFHRRNVVRRRRGRTSPGAPAAWRLIRRLRPFSRLARRSARCLLHLGTPPRPDRSAGCSTHGCRGDYPPGTCGRGRRTGEQPSSSSCLEYALPHAYLPPTGIKGIRPGQRPRRRAVRGIERVLSLGAIGGIVAPVVACFANTSTASPWFAKIVRRVRSSSGRDSPDIQT